MKKLSAALLLWLALTGAAQAENTVGPSAQILCNKSAFVSPTTATTTAIVSGIAGQSIFLCGWHVTSILSTTSTFLFEYGTQGGPCTTPTAITPAFNVTSAAPSSDHISLATIQIPAGAQLCVVTGAGTTGDAVIVYYSQF